MPTIPSLGEAIPKVKASIPELAKFLLLALGWIVGRLIHVEIHHMLLDEEGKGMQNILQFPCLLDNTKDYILNTGDIATIIALGILSWVLFKWGKILKWFGVGLFLYIVTFELYELLWGQVITQVTPALFRETTPNNGGDGF